MSEDVKHPGIEFIAIYNNGSVVSYNRLPENIPELLEMGIVKCLINRKDLSVAVSEFEFKGIRKVTYA